MMETLFRVESTAFLPNILDTLEEQHHLFQSKMMIVSLKNMKRIRILQTK